MFVVCLCISTEYKFWRDRFGPATSLHLEVSRGSYTADDYRSSELYEIRNSSGAARKEDFEFEGTDELFTADRAQQHHG